MRKVRTGNVGRLRSELENATTPAQVARIFRNASVARIPHGELRVADELPGYRYDDDTARYYRIKAAATGAGELTVAATLAEKAIGAFDVIDGGYATRVDKSVLTWRLLQYPNIEPGKLVSTVNQAPLGRRRAELVRAMLPLEAVVLGRANPKGVWGDKPNGNLTGDATLKILATQFDRHPEPEHGTLDPVTWSAVEGIDDMPLVRRRQPLLSVTHQGFLVARRLKGGRQERGHASRHLDVHQDTVFAMDPEIAKDLLASPDMLEETYKSNGSDMEDMIVPAAGFVVVRQLVEIGQITTVNR